MVEGFKDITSFTFIEEGMKAYDDYIKRSEMLSEGAKKVKVSTEGASGGVKGLSAASKAAARETERLNDQVLELEKRARRMWAKKWLPGNLTPYGVETLGMEEGSRERQIKLAEFVVEDIENAFDIAEEALGRDPSRGERMLSQALGGMQGWKQSAEGRVSGTLLSQTNEFSQVAHELAVIKDVLTGTDLDTEAYRELFNVEQARDQYTYLLRANMLHKELAQDLKVINTEEEKSLETVSDYQGALDQAKQNANQLVDAYNKVAAAQMEMFWLQSRYNEEIGSGSIEASDELKAAIEDAFGFYDAKLFASDLNQAIAAVISNLDKEVQRTSLEAMGAVDEWKGLAKSLEGLKLSEDLMPWVEGMIEDQEIKELRIQEIKADRLLAAEAAVTDIFDVASAFGSGDVFGGLSGLSRSSGTLQGQVAGAVFEGFAQFAKLGELATDSSVKQVASEIVKSAEVTVENFEKGIDVFMEVLPDLIKIIMVELPVAIVKSLPEMTVAFYEAFALGLTEVLGWLKGAWEWFQNLFGRSEEEKRQDRQNAKQARADWWQDFKGGFRNQFQEGYQSFASGTGYVSRTGLALLHKGESVVPVNGRAQQGASVGSGGVNININASMIDRDVIPRLVREIEKATSKWGRMSASFA